MSHHNTLKTLFVVSSFTVSDTNRSARVVTLAVCVSSPCEHLKLTQGEAPFTRQAPAPSSHQYAKNRAQVGGGVCEK